MFSLTVAEAHTFYVGANGWLVHNAGLGCGIGNPFDLPSGLKLTDGMKLPIDSVLNAATEFLGPGYKYLGSGRFISADGTRVVRMGDRDILGLDNVKGVKHMNFETLIPNPNKAGKMMVDKNYHIELVGK